MNNQFDELTKGLSRGAGLKNVGVGLAAMALACFGLAYRTTAAPTFTTLDVPGAGVSLL